MPTIKPVKGGFQVTHTTREVFGVDDICPRCGVDHDGNNCPKQSADNQLVDLLWDYLKRDPEHKDRRQTGGGTKTKVGLAASIRRILG